MEKQNIQDYLNNNNDILSDDSDDNKVENYEYINDPEKYLSWA